MRRGMVAIALLVALVFLVFYGAQPLARVDYNPKIPSYYFAGDFADPDDCEAGRLPCVKASRAEVWWLEAQNIVLVQLPTVWQSLREKEGRG